MWNVFSIIFIHWNHYCSFCNRYLVLSIGYGVFSSSASRGRKNVILELVNNILLYQRKPRKSLTIWLSKRHKENFLKVIWGEGNQQQTHAIFVFEFKVILRKINQQ